MIEFLETDAQGVYDKTMAHFADAVGEDLYPGDERRIFAEALAMILMLTYNDLNDAGRQKMLRYAKGEVLDALAERVGVERIAPVPASDVFRFTISEPQTRSIVIPAGTRITMDEVIYFATDETGIMPAGELSVDVNATCTTPGEDYNDITAGSINILIDLQPYITEVANLYGTSGGDNGEEYTDDGDEKLRERIRLANSAFSVAGPEEAYKYHVLSSNAQITDVYVDSPSACAVDIYALMEGGTLATDEIKEGILDALNEQVRPMTDFVTVKDPEVVPYDIEVKYYCTKENEAAAVNFVEIEGGAVDAYVDWQHDRLGRDITPDALRRSVMQNTDELGVLVERMDIVAPAFIKLKPAEVAGFSGTLKITHEVIE